LLCPYCISGSYRRVAPVPSLFLVPLVPVAHGARHEGPHGSGDRAAKGAATVLNTRCTHRSSLSCTEYLLPCTVALEVQSRREVSRPCSNLRLALWGSRSGSARRMKAFPGFARAALLRFDDEFSRCAADAAVGRSERSLTAAAGCQSPAVIGFTQRLEADRGLEKTRHPPGLRRKMQAPCHPVSCTPSSRRSGR